jgi:hypothetical protein
MRNRRASVWLPCCLALVCSACSQSPAPAPVQSLSSPTGISDPRPAPTGPTTDPTVLRYALGDCHLHLVDFLQRTDGIQAVVAAMDKAGVTDAVIHGMPLVKEWPQEERLRPEYYLADDSRCYWYSATDILVARQVQSLPPEQQKRFHPTICGFNGADRNAVEHVKRMIDWYPGFWQGIGEVMARHDDLTALTYGDPARADNHALDAVFTFAGKHDLPVFLHSNIGSVWKREPIYLPEVEEAFRTHPNTRFVWCHAGISRRIDIPTLPQVLGDLLGKYPNLHIDVSWVVYQTYLLTPDGKPSEPWVKLVEAYPDRFIIGSDIVGHFAAYPHEVLRYYTFLDALKPDTAQKLARGNLLAVLPKTGARLTEEESASLNGYKSGTQLLK